MSIWRDLTRGLRALINRTKTDHDIADEVEHYMEQATSTFERSGLSPEEARRAARLELGNATAVREQMREYGWENRDRHSSGRFALWRAPIVQQPGLYGGRRADVGAGHRCQHRDL